MENGLRTLFTEDKRNQETNVKMNSKSVNELAKKLCTFVDVKFETLANSGHISNVCNSAIQLFCSIGEVVSYLNRQIVIVFFNKILFYINFEKLGGTI